LKVIPTASVSVTVCVLIMVFALCTTDLQIIVVLFGWFIAVQVTDLVLTDFCCRDRSSPRAKGLLFCLNLCSLTLPVIGLIKAAQGDEATAIILFAVSKLTLSVSGLLFVLLFKG
jgi:hypothetical protein